MGVHEFYLEGNFFMINIRYNCFKNVQAHIISWGCFIGYELLILTLVSKSDFEFGIVMLHYSISIIFFYLISFKSFTWALKNKNSLFWKLPFAVLFQLSLYLSLHYLLDELLLEFCGGKISISHKFDIKYIISASYRCIYFMGFALAYYLLRNFLEVKKISELLEKQRLNDIIQQQQMEQEIVNAENAFLKAQINPHFLFNTLDFIYHEAHGSSPIAGEAIIDLSNMMRYAMDAGRNGGVEVLGKEIEQVESLIHLYQLRKRGKYCIEFQATAEVKDLYLIPLVLLTLVENVFKHGELLDEGNPASIRLWTENKCLHISTHNGVAASSFMKKSGHGLANTANRLHFAYGNAASLKSEQVNGNFQTEVSVPVDLLRRPAPPVLSSIKTDKE